MSGMQKTIPADRPGDPATILGPILIGGVLAAALQLGAALIQGNIRGTAPMQVMQYVASGLLGVSAFEGGVRTATIGVVTQLVIAIGAAAMFVMLGHAAPVLRKRWVVAGVVYGAVVWSVMNLIVLPASLTPFPPRHTPASVALGLAIHICCVGLPIAWVARRR